MEYRGIAERLISYKKQLCKHSVKDLLNATKYTYSSKNFCDNCYEPKRLTKYGSNYSDFLSADEFRKLKLHMEEKFHEKGISKMEKIISWRHSKNILLRKLSRVKL